MVNGKSSWAGFARSAFAWVSISFLVIVFFVVMEIWFFVIVFFDRDRVLMHPVLRAWVKSVLTLCPFMRVRIEGAERLKPKAAYVFAANHQSIADIPAVLLLKRPFKFVAKQELFWIPFFGWALYLAGYIPLLRGNKKSGKVTLDRARQYLKRGVPVLFFPEGTRSPDGEIQPFKAGAFKLASDLGVPVVPMVIDGTRRLMPKGSRLVGRAVDVVLRVGSPHSPNGKGAEAVETLTDEVRADMIRMLAEIRSRGTVELNSGK